jgi:hypothetical protein
VLFYYYSITTLALTPAVKIDVKSANINTLCAFPH